MALTLSERSAITVAVESWLSGELMTFMQHTVTAKQKAKEMGPHGAFIVGTSYYVYFFHVTLKMAVMYSCLCQIHVDIKWGLPICNYADYANG